jgi:UDP:flavonoid glycosyltransferase YjiC (YdhE family)
MVFAVASAANTQPRYNSIRAKIGAKAIDHYELYYRRVVITPSIFGLDMAQQLCPNVFAVGFLRRKGGATTISAMQMPDEWSRWAEKCSDPGMIYINMGSIGVLPNKWVDEIARAVHNLSNKGHCVLWKVSPTQIDGLKTELENLPNVKLTIFLPFAPPVLLRHPSLKIFVTHCGDTSVYEALQALVPMVGIPLFADQPDMCARVKDAGIGTWVDKFTLTGDKLVAAVDDTLRSESDIRKRSRALTAMGLSLGGAPRAVDIIERAATFGTEISLLFCHHIDLPWYQHYEVDVLAAISLAVYAVLLGVRYCCCSKRKRKLKKE